MTIIWFMIQQKLGTLTYHAHEQTANKVCFETMSNEGCCSLQALAVDPAFRAVGLFGNILKQVEGSQIIHFPVSQISDDSYDSLA